jgi:hypothetical protein
MMNEIPCPFCGEEIYVGVLEYFSGDGSILLETCCEASNELATVWLPLCDRGETAAWFRQCTGLGIRQIIHDETPNWCVDPGLALCDVSWEVAKDFIRRHRHNRPPQGWKFGKGVSSGRVDRGHDGRSSSSSKPRSLDLD